MQRALIRWVVAAATSATILVGTSALSGSANAALCPRPRPSVISDEDRAVRVTLTLAYRASTTDPRVAGLLNTNYTYEYTLSQG